MCYDFDFSGAPIPVKEVWDNALVTAECEPFVVDRSDLVRVEHIVFQFQRETILRLLEQIHLLVEYQGQLIQRQTAIDNLRRELGELLVALNKSDSEYVQPGKIMN